MASRLDESPKYLERGAALYLCSHRASGRLASTSASISNMTSPDKELHHGPSPPLSKPPTASTKCHRELSIHLGHIDFAFITCCLSSRVAKPLTLPMWTPSGYRQRERRVIIPFCIILCYYNPITGFNEAVHT